MTNENAGQLPFSEVEELVKEIDPGDENDHKAAVTVFSCMVVGVDTDALSLYTGYEKSLIKPIVENLHKNNQVKDGLLLADWLCDDHFDETGFLLTVLCAMGMITIEEERPKTIADHVVASSQTYKHPDDPELTWAGRGRRPQWLRELLEDGVTLEELQTA